MLRPQPTANARYVRRRPHHPTIVPFALLAHGGLCAQAYSAGAEEPPRYETVVVAPPEQARADRAASSSVITTDRTPRAAESVTRLLSEQSGATVTRLGGMGATATMSLRGSTANQVSVYLDGVPLNSAVGGGVDLGSIPVADVERIEIYRGMSPMTFGASAIGGVVSITTAVPTAHRAEIELGGGSFGTAYGAARGAWAGERVRVYGGLHALTSDGDFAYVDTQNTNLTHADDHATRRRNNDLHQVDGMLRSVLELSDNHRLSASLLFFDRVQGLPGPASLAHPTARLGTLRTTGILGYESRAAFGPGGKLRITLHGNRELSHFEDRNADINVSPTDARDRTYTGGGSAAWRWVAGSWLVLSGIVDVRYDRFSPSDAEASGSPGTRLFGAAGVESDFYVHALALDIVPSFRLELARERTSGRDDFDHFLSTSDATNHVLPIVRLALIKRLTAWLSLRANAGRYARLPSLIELYGNTGYLLGNSELEPESGFNADLGPQVSWTSGASRVRWTTAAFASVVDDLIQLQYGNGRARPENMGSARILGVETEATLELGPHLRTVFAATLTDARDTSSIEAQHGRQLPFRPRYHVYLRPEWRAIHVSSRIALGLYVDGDATAGNFLDPANSVAAPARILLGAGAYADLPWGFSIRVSAQNLADSRVYDINNYPLPGREMYLSVAWAAQNREAKQGGDP